MAMIPCFSELFEFNHVRLKEVRLRRAHRHNTTRHHRQNRGSVRIHKTSSRHSTHTTGSVRIKTPTPTSTDHSSSILKVSDMNTLVDS